MRCFFDVTFVFAQNYFMIFASLSIVQASLTLPSFIAKSNQNARAVLKRLNYHSAFIILVYASFLLNCERGL